jgi:hypothetical protein
MRIAALHFDGVGTAPDLECRMIFEAQGGKLKNCVMSPTTGERVVEYNVPAKEVPALRAVLTAADFKLVAPNFWRRDQMPSSRLQ